MTADPRKELCIATRVADPIHSFSTIPCMRFAILTFTSDVDSSMLIASKFEIIASVATSKSRKFSYVSLAYP